MFSVQKSAAAEAKQALLDQTNGANAFFSVVFTPLLPATARQCLGPTCHLSTLN
jgi:hypothetical protein